MHINVNDLQEYCNPGLCLEVQFQILPSAIFKKVTVQQLLSI